MIHFCDHRQKIIVITPWIHIEDIHKKMYNDVVQQCDRYHIRFGVLIMTCLMLTSCSIQKDTPSMKNPHSALIPAVILSQKDHSAPSLSRPSALLGLHVTQFLSRRSTLFAKAAVNGVLIQLRRFPHIEKGNLIMATIEQLGTLLHRDIADSLNQSTNRRYTLDLYIERLRKATTEASIQSTSIKEEFNQYTNEYRIHKSHTRQISAELKRALRDGNYSLASQKQQELGEAQSLLANAEAQVEKMKGILALYEELLPLAEERLTAIDKNREVIVAGLHVIDVPGIENLGIFDRMR